MQQDFWLPLAIPVSFVSISASIAPDQLLGPLDRSDRIIALGLLAMLALFTLAAAATDTTT